MKKKVILIMMQRQAFSVVYGVIKRLSTLRVIDEGNCLMSMWIYICIMTFQSVSNTAFVMIF